MLCEKLGLAVPQFGQMSLQRSGDLRMRLPADIAQQAAVLRVLHQRVLKAVNRIRGCATLEYQLGSDKTRECPLQCVVADPSQCGVARKKTPLRSPNQSAPPARTILNDSAAPSASRVRWAEFRLVPLLSKTLLVNSPTTNGTPQRYIRDTVQPAERVELRAERHPFRLGSAACRLHFACCFCCDGTRACTPA